MFSGAKNACREESEANGVADVEYGLERRPGTRAGPGGRLQRRNIPWRTRSSGHANGLRESESASRLTLRKALEKSVGTRGQLGGTNH
uniref:Uncharacterized protein n=1 Tax=Mycena chlorophos TaxID=658473 RepID=A0ABQ0MBY1_MYCCL|nr:predicted protein [Mycena chlorophos]